MKRPSERKTAPACWLFCSVIDNYGDIGVSWRLAQILQRELGWQVHLWLDDEAALRALSPGLPSPPCTHENIVVRRWQPGRQAEAAAQLGKAALAALGIIGFAQEAAAFFAETHKPEIFLQTVGLQRGSGVQRFVGGFGAEVFPVEPQRLCLTHFLQNIGGQIAAKGFDHDLRIGRAVQAFGLPPGLPAAHHNIFMRAGWGGQAGAERAQGGFIIEP